MCCLVLRSLSCLFPHLLKIINWVKIKVRIWSIFQWTSINLKHVGTFESLILPVHSVSFSELSCFSRTWSALGRRSQSACLRSIYDPKLSSSELLVLLAVTERPSFEANISQVSQIRCWGIRFVPSKSLLGYHSPLKLLYRPPTVPPLAGLGPAWHGDKSSSVLGNSGTTLASAARKQVGNVFVLC